MNNELSDAVIDAVALLFVTVGKDPDPATLRAYGAGLVPEGTGILATLKGIVKEAMDGAFHQPPSVEDILDTHRKADTRDPKFVAREAASLILGAISRHGWCNPKEARTYMGELAWKVTEMQGGWAEICESTTNQNKVHLQAQWRDLAEAILAKPAGSFDQPPGLPGLPQGDVPGIPSDALKLALKKAGR